MAPSPVRQLLVWSLPSIAVLLSYLWYKKRRIGVRSDGGGSKPLEEEGIDRIKNKEIVNKELLVEKKTEVKTESTPASSPPKKSFNRSLSGIETAPIPIVYPPELRSSKSSPVVISDEDLDIEIEKIKSMKNGYSSPSTISATLSKNPLAKGEDCGSPKSAKTGRPANSPNKSGENSPNKSRQNSLNKCCENSPNKSRENSPNKSRENSPNKSRDNLLIKTREENSPKIMAQKDLVAVEEKLSKVSVTKSSKSPKDKKQQKKSESNDSSDLHRQNSGRDSANHSPSDVMLASPSLSSISDNHSEGSSDSGKGCSDVATPPPSRTPNSSLSSHSNLPSTYEFIIPQTLVGKLIGRQGCFVQQIKEKTRAHVVVRKHPTSNKLKICCMEGTQNEIDKALKMIREKFPLKKYSEVTLEQVSFTPLIPTVSLIPDHLYLKLVEGINNDTILSCMVAPNHLFMQQPTHPTFPNLNVLKSYMNSCYNVADSPMLPKPIPENTICAAYSIDSWYRAMILSSDAESDTSYVKFLDYGGYAYVENENLRQIRQDFMLLPFQAAECILSNVKPINEDGTWSEGAYQLVADVTKGSIIYTQIADYTEEGIPCVLCYVVTGPQDVVFLNQRLVDEGYAEWVPFEELQDASAVVSQITVEA